MSRSLSAALPIAWVTLRILIVVNWIGGALVLALLVAALLQPSSTLTALGVDAAMLPILPPMLAVMACGLAAVPLHYVVLRRLLAMVERVRIGDPFAGGNAGRLRSIAWALLGLQLLSVAVWLLGGAIRGAGVNLHLGAELSTGGWLAVLLAFILARVFATGAEMRDDLEGTV